MSDSSGSSSAAIIVSSLILAVGVLAGSLIIRSSVDNLNGELTALRTAVASPAAAVARAPQPTAPPRRGLDPSKRYSVNTAGAPAKGPDSARVSIIEFSDFQCPFCARASPTLERIEQEYGDQVRIVFKHLPLSSHPKAPAAHAAAEAAHRQGKFWEMHDAIFADQRNMSADQYVEYAHEMGLDVDRFKQDVVSDSVKKRVDTDRTEAAALGVSGTPTFFVNGRFVSGAKPFESFKVLIDEALGKG